ncbi:iron-containing redox enzyme family protein [Myxococcus sp. RHSTA-1-4]|uniref:iron-containing redox enzyme family protein n=1 Tax=Myxococcus sp. RHSTA-1-4 TaxID=2874601 RepID=UPI001CC0F9DE|nr:iron-containing redox enzyme family protein [Myxococcus sp. RHSTA-1-4]
MEEACRQLSLMADSEPIAPGLIKYFRQLILEERGHDDWLLDSLEALGHSREGVRAHLPPPTVAAMVGMQYYWIYHHHPVALLGFIKVVENNPSSAEQIERVMRHTGLPRDAFRYHLEHVHIEPRHNALLDRVLDSLPLTAEHELLIGMSAARTIHYLARSLDEIMTLSELPRASESSSHARLLF